MKWLLTLYCITAACMAPAQTLHDVYVGAQLYNTPFDGMQVNNIVIYFRKDGSFNDQLNTTNWRTAVTGSYVIKNNVVKLSFKNGQEPLTYQLAPNGNLLSMAGIKHTLHKVKKISSLTAATYEKRSGSSRGGMGTGLPTVGAFSSSSLYFDGKGNFAFNKSGIVGVGADDAAGKYENETKTSGKYKLGDGEIIFTFKDGRVSRHSFFYSPPNEEDLILVDGEFYFRAEAAAAETAVAETIVAETASAERKHDGLPSAAELMSRLRSRYGGEHIDKITTLKETATITGNMEAVSITDVLNNKIRLEIRQGGQLLMVKQLEGDSGWQWIKGKRSPLLQRDREELQLSVYQGILGLHKKLNNYFMKGTVDRSGSDYMISFYKGDRKLVYLIGSDYSLKGNAYSVTEAPNMSVYKNFNTSHGITYPSVTESSDGKNKLVVTTTAIEFNPVLSADSWKAP
ncbi:hypothetical protein [Longitalea arenae]|uniref:hypothetical protein n=1 Tax=Longitalea arenae TaxID=2812558 RepID=UPI001968438D|nr:hypothetical protein [Longitalea arenae]